MKKILLIITIAFLIFQMVVLATSINVGNEAIDRTSGQGVDGRTTINKGNPANASGTITSVELWAQIDLNNVKFATFFVVSGNNLSTRDTYTHSGIISSGSKQTISGLSIDVEEGDYIGIQASHGSLESDHSDLTGLWYANAEFIPCTNETFTYVANWGVSLCGIGITEEEPTHNFFGYNSN